MEGIRWILEIYHKELKGQPGYSISRFAIMCEIARRPYGRLTASEVAVLLGLSMQQTYIHLRALKDAHFVYRGRLTVEGCKLLGLSTDEYMPGPMIPQISPDKPRLKESIAAYAKPEDRDWLADEEPFPTTPTPYVDPFARPADADPVPLADRPRAQPVATSKPGDAPRIMPGVEDPDDGPEPFLKGALLPRARPDLEDDEPAADIEPGVEAEWAGPPVGLPAAGDDVF